MRGVLSGVFSMASPVLAVCLVMTGPSLLHAQPTLVYVVDELGQLGTVDLSSGASSVIGHTGAALTDIAITSSGAMWGVDFYGAYSVNKSTGQASYLGYLGASAGGMNALVGQRKALIGASVLSTSLYAVSASTGETFPLSGSTAYPSSGDLAFHEGRLYSTVINGSFNDLLRIELSGSAFVATNLGHLPGSGGFFSLVQGTDGRLYGLSGRQVWRVDVDTPAQSVLVVADYGASGSGLQAANGAAPGASVFPDQFDLSNLGGSSGSIAVASLPGNAWTARSNAPWLTITTGQAGTGNGTVNFSVTANGGPPRTGTLTVAGYEVTVTQGATVSNTAAITINDASTAGPYPSTVIVDGVQGLVGNVSVTLHGLTHGAPGDLDMVLVGPGGQAFSFMSDQGGWTAANGLSVTFDDDALAPPSSVLTLGSFKPANLGGGDVFPPPGPQASHVNAAPAGAGTFGNVFGGTNPNGPWRLYVIDDASWSSGVIAGGWSLSIRLNASSAPPAVPGQPAPADGAQLTAAPVALDWQDSSGATSYEVFLDGVAQGEVTASQWAVPASLPLGRHVWSVVARNGFGETPGPDWTFFVVATSFEFDAFREHDGVVQTSRVALRRVDRVGDALNPSLPTWLVVHGRGSSPDEANIRTLISVLTLTARRTGEQVVALDWRAGAAATSPLDFQGEGWIKPVGVAAAGALGAYGFEGETLRIIGHSWGSYVADEVAASIPRRRTSPEVGVGSIVGLDPARNTWSTNYNVNDPGEINFAAHSSCSWAFNSSEAGNAETPGTAHEAFVVNFGLPPTIANTALSHSLIVDLFAEMVRDPRGEVSAYFALDRLRNCSGGPVLGPWRPNRISVGGDRLSLNRPYEAAIRASATVPSSIDFDLLEQRPDAEDDAHSLFAGQVLSVAAPGVLVNDHSAGTAGLAAALLTPPRAGTLSLASSGAFTYRPDSGFVGSDRFVYQAWNAAGAGTIGVVTIFVGASGAPLPLLDFRILDVAGSTVRLGWTLPSVGPRPSAILLEGGTEPGQVLGALQVPALPETRVTLPPGLFYLRARSVFGSTVSLPSAERTAAVAVPVSPSAPERLLGLVNGSSLALAWRNTYGAGAPASVRLNVSGAVNGSIPIGAVERFDFAGVPPGTYTFSVEATNAVGASIPSRPVTLTFPGACSGAPAIPDRFTAYAVGPTIFLRWELPADGAAPASFLVRATGAFTGVVPTPNRELSGAVPPGAYTLSVSGVNACGVGPATAPITVTVR